MPLKLPQGRTTGLLNGFAPRLSENLKLLANSSTILLKSIFGITLAVRTPTKLKHVFLTQPILLHAVPDKEKAEHGNSQR